MTAPNIPLTLRLVKGDKLTWQEADNNFSNLKSGIINLIPDTTNNSGKYLTTDGTSLSWVTGMTNPMTAYGDLLVGGASGIPSRLPLGSNGQSLTISSGTLQWTTLLPDQTGNNGKFLTTNGTTTNWSTLLQIPSITNNNGKVLTTDGNTISWSNLVPYTDVTVTASSATGTVDLGTSFIINMETASASGRFRLYRSADGRAIDQNRDTSTLPPSSVGCLIDDVFIDTALTVLSIPAPGSPDQSGVCYWAWSGNLGSTITLRITKLI